jgi:SulP family sulfate permease
MGLATGVLDQPIRAALDAARAYSPRKLRRDLVAGLTVAIVAVPQSMAYALIADVPPVYGLYTAMIQGALAACFTSSSHLSSGPINTLSLLVASAVARVVPDPAQRISAVFAMTFLVGLIQIACAATRFSGFVHYVSHSVIVGFTAGAGVLIAAGQIPAFLGIATEKTRNLPGLLGIIERMTPHLGDVNWRAVGIGVGSLAVVLVARAIWRFLPGPLLAAGGAGLLVWAMNWTAADVPQIGQLPAGLPSFAWPPLSWTTGEALFGGAMALALVGVLEAYSIARSIAEHTEQRINPNREFLAQGASNLLSSFFQCIPGSGSFSRSALNYQAGAQTRMAGVYCSLFVAAMFLLFAGPARHIPHASLAAILFVIAYGLVDWRYIRRVLPASRSDAAVCATTFLATLLIPLEFAIVVGVFLNLGLYLRKASRLHLVEMVESGKGRFLEVPLHDRSGQKQVIFLQIEGELFFGVADELAERLGALAQSNARVVIFRLRRTHSIDSTVLQVMQRFVRQIQSRGGHVILCGLKTELLQPLRAFGLVDLIGADNVFAQREGVFGAARAALERARRLVGSSIDTVPVEDELDEEPAMYEI